MPEADEKAPAAPDAAAANKTSPAPEPVTDPIAAPIVPKEDGSWREEVVKP